jgi:hypothetical protein
MSAETPSFATAVGAVAPISGRALRLRRSMRIVVLFVIAFFPLSVVIANAGKPLDPIGITVAVLLTGVCGFFGWAAIRARFWIDAHGIASRAPFGKRPSIAWADVTEVAAEPASGGYVIRGAGVNIVLTGTLDGLDALAALVLTHVPAASVKSDAVRRSLELRAHRFAPRLDFPCPVEPAEPAREAAARRRSNPFYVLGLPTDCARADVERAGRKLLGLLEIGASSAKTYDSPFGRGERTADVVRAAIAELAVPERRAARELEAHLVLGGDAPPDAAADDPTRPWPEAFAAGGWRST